MLKELTIRNFAIIDDLHIIFSDGLTILSGETGAGKSIIINAVNLLLGSRASADLVRTGTENAELEAIFDVDPASKVAQIMTAQGYDAAGGLLIRRIISRSDSNRVYINGHLATIHLLNTITDSLASISGQHAHQGLLREDQHLLILDQFGSLMSLREEVSKAYNEIIPIIKSRDNLLARKTRQTEQTELLEFQRNEINTAAPAPGEDQELEQERIRLKNAEQLYETAYAGIEALYAAPGSIVERLAEVRKALEKTAQIDPQLRSKGERVSEAAYHIESVVEDLRSYLATVETDERRLEAVEERLDTLNKLKRKHGGSLEAVFEKLETINAELTGIENISDRIDEIEKQLIDCQSRLTYAASKLSKKRKTAAEKLAKKVVSELAGLKMANTDFKVALDTDAADRSSSPYLVTGDKLISDTGIDRAAFMIAPNIGEELKPLAGIASGGELSRVVLALKSILAAADSLETVVFDEVDAGIGGGTAEVVGRKLADLSRHHQILCITHLPQIAKFGKHHFNISKRVIDRRTHTQIKPLGADDRTREIARMLGGEKITQKTLDHAKELLET